MLTSKLYIDSVCTWSLRYLSFYADTISNQLKAHILENKMQPWCLDVIRNVLYQIFILWYKSCWFMSCFSITWFFSCLYLISSVYPKKESCNWNTAQKSGRKEVGKQKIGLCLWCKTYLYRIHKRDIDERHFCVSSLKRPLVSYKTIIVSIEEITSWMKIDHPQNLKLH